VAARARAPGRGLRADSTVARTSALHIRPAFLVRMAGGRARAAAAKPSRYAMDPVSQQVHYKTYKCEISIKRDDASEMFFFQYLRQVPLNEPSWSKFTFVRLFLLICTMNCHHHVDRESFTISFYNILPVLQPARTPYKRKFSCVVKWPWATLPPASLSFVASGTASFRQMQQLIITFVRTRAATTAAPPLRQTLSLPARRPRARTHTHSAGPEARCIANVTSAAPCPCAARGGGRARCDDALTDPG